MTTFGSQIKAIRSKLGMSQAEFAEAAGVSQGSVSKWERDLEQPKTAAWLRIRGLYQWQQNETIAGPYDPLRPQSGSPSVAGALLVGALERPLKADVFESRFDTFGMMTMPYIEEYGDNILAWVVPVLNYQTPDYNPGTVVYSTWVVEDLELEPDEKVIVQSRSLDGEYIYSVCYYGVSAKGLEWFTPSRTTEAEVKLSDTHPVTSRQEHGIRVVGKVIAALVWESSMLNFLERMTSGEPSDPFGS